MTRQKAARQPRANAETGPDTRATVRAGSRIGLTTVRADRRAAADAPTPLTEAQILVGTTSWLVDLRDRLAEQLDLAEGTTLAMPRATLEAMRDGLTHCAGWLDTLTVDPAQLPPPDRAPARAPTAAAHAPSTPSPRTLQ